MKDTNIFMKLAGGLLIITGIIEIINNIQLLNTGISFLTDKPITGEISELRFATISGICISVFFLICGVGVLLNNKVAMTLSYWAAIFYFISSMVNGQLLFGQIFQPEISISITVSLLIATFIYLGKKPLYESQYRH